MLDLGSGRHTVLKQGTDILDRADLQLADYLTKVESVEFPTTDGETAFGLFYPPHNPDYAGPGDGERPPLLVHVPRRADLGDRAGFNWSIQFWTSRGIAVLDVNYRGSTGYRPRLSRPPAPGSGASSTSTTAFMARAILAERGASMASAASSAAAAPAATPRWRADLPRLLPGGSEPLRRRATLTRWRATPTSSSRATSTG